MAIAERTVRRMAGRERESERERERERERESRAGRGGSPPHDKKASGPLPTSHVPETKQSMG